MNIKELYKKYREQIAYLFYGCLTTAVDFATFGILADILKVNEMAANITATFVSIVFAFFTSKFRVFDSKKSGNTIFEFFTFFAGRLVSFAISNGGFWYFAEKLGYNSYLVKGGLAVFVVITNYLVSKFFVFKKK